MVIEFFERFLAEWSWVSFWFVFGVISLLAFLRRGAKTREPVLGMCGCAYCQHLRGEDT